MTKYKSVWIKKEKTAGPEIKKQMICRNASICKSKDCTEKIIHDYNFTCKIPCQNKFGIVGSICHQVVREMKP